MSYNIYLTKPSSELYVGVLVSKQNLSFFTAIFCLIAIILSSCARSPIKGREQALRPIRSKILIQDDLQFFDFKNALEKNISALKKSSQTHLFFGPVVVSKDMYIQKLEELFHQIQTEPHFQNVEAWLNQNFVLFEVFGTKKWSEIFMTSYYEPIIEGSSSRTQKFSQPLYSTPRDLVQIQMNGFAARFPELKIQQSTWRGRLVLKNEPPHEILPYYSRSEIDSPEKPLKKNSDIIAWVDPIDAFFLQVQGSGRVRLKDGKEILVNYASQNGHEYVAIGQFLFDAIPREKMSKHQIVNHLQKLPPNERQELLNRNPSYVFFRKSKQKAVTAFGTEAVAGRTIATDAKFFSKGALAFLEFDMPVFDSADSKEPSGFQKRQRLVFDQDVGGAIKGPGRVDLFWGSGPEAERYSGVIKNPGRLFYLVPKESVSM